MKQHAVLSLGFVVLFGLYNTFHVFLAQSTHLGCLSPMNEVYANLSATPSQAYNLSTTTTATTIDRRSTNEAAFATARGMTGNRTTYSTAKWTSEWSSNKEAVANETAEAYIIAFQMDQVEKFKIRNTASDITNKGIWFPALNGGDPKIMEGWLDMTKQLQWKENASVYIKEFIKDPSKGPHAIGCYLSHWHVLRMIAQRKPGLRPDIVFIFEEDAACIPQLMQRTMKIVTSLPEDWDLLFIGGKPFTYFKNVTNVTFDTTELQNLKSLSAKAKSQRVRKLACSGLFGNGESPLAPDGSRRLTLEQEFWQTKYTTNTEAYVVNTKRIDHILNLISKNIRSRRAIDLVYADAMTTGQIKAYMPTLTFCTQGRARRIDKPFPWMGYFGLRPANYTGSFHYHWDELYFPECASMY